MFPTLKRIAFTGRFASLGRPRAIEILTEHGGLFRNQVTNRTDVLVIGADGWPLRSTGALTKNLLCANRLKETGHPIEIIGEALFLRRMDETISGSHIRAKHSVEQLSRLLGVSGLRIRHWIELGLLQASPDSGLSPMFDFQAVSAARLISRLIFSGVSPVKLADTLRTLQKWLPDDESLLHSIVALERQLLVRTASGEIVDPHGQTYFAFDDKTDTTLSLHETYEFDAEELFDRAFTSERSGRFDEAINQYKSWLSRFGNDDEVRFNLANVLDQIGQLEESIGQYRQLVESSPHLADAWNNLGLCQYRNGEISESINSLRCAVELEPKNVDALYNYADALDEIGSVSEARKLWIRIAKLSIEDEIVHYAKRRVSMTKFSVVGSAT